MLKISDFWPCLSAKHPNIYYNGRSSSGYWLHSNAMADPHVDVNLCSTSIANTDHSFRLAISLYASCTKFLKVLLCCHNIALYLVPYSLTILYFSLSHNSVWTVSPLGFLWLDLMIWFMLMPWMTHSNVQNENKKDQQVKRIFISH